MSRCVEKGGEAQGKRLRMAGRPSKRKAGAESRQRDIPRRHARESMRKEARSKKVDERVCGSSRCAQTGLRSWRKGRTDLPALEPEEQRERAHGFRAG
eukprot:2844341-Pleurochrysis_carterae.AAC.1